MAGQPTWLSIRGNVLVLALHVQPGAHRTAVAGEHAERLKIAVAAPPADGRANAALLAFLASRLGVAPSSIQLVSGANSRIKRVALNARLTADAVRAALLAGPETKARK